jgi:hypothetical protein
MLCRSEQMLMVCWLYIHSYLFSLTVYLFYSHVADSIMCSSITCLPVVDSLAGLAKIVLISVPLIRASYRRGSLPNHLIIC